MSECKYDCQTVKRYGDKWKCMTCGRVFVPADRVAKIKRDFLEAWHDRKSSVQGGGTG